MTPKYWLMKCEPSAYSIDDLKKDRVTHWEGVRNYQARNYMRDEMRLGDLVLFYQSNADPSGIVGLARVHKEAYPDRFALEPSSKYFDPKSSIENPRWVMIDICFLKEFAKPIPLTELREIQGLEKMCVLKKGSRLSITPVTEKEYKIIMETYGYETTPHKNSKECP